MTSPSVRRELQALLTLAGPLVLAQLAQTSLSFVDTVMVGRLGQGALAGIAVGGVLFAFTVIVSSGVLYAVGPLASQAHGAERPDQVAAAVRQGLWLALLLSAPGLLMFGFAEPLLLALGQEAAPTEAAAGYLRAMMWALPSVLLGVPLRGFLEAMADSRPIMVIALLGVGLNVPANIALMYGYWGFPALGLVGTGYASALVYALMLVGLALYIRLRYSRYGIFEGLRRPDPATLGELVQVGVPIGMTAGFEVGLFGAAALLMGVIDAVQLSAHQIAIQSASVTFMVPVGISLATAVRVGHAVGRRDPDGVRRAGLLGAALCVVAMVLSASLFRFAPGLVIGLYLDPAAPENAELVRYAAAFLGVAALFQVVDGLQVSMASALRGLKDTRRPMLLTLIAYWLVGMPVGVWLAFGVGLEGRGLWLGLVAGLTLAALLLSLRFWQRLREVPGSLVAPAGSGVD